jgi:autotransporter-associated beta strand protein
MTGTTTISAGTLLLSGSGSVEESDEVDVNGTLDIQNVTTNQGDPGISGAAIKRLTGSGTIQLGSNRLYVTNASNDTFDGIINSADNDNAGLTLEEGSLTLTGQHTYLGFTSIETGATLKLTGSASFDEDMSAVFFGNGTGTFDISGIDSETSIQSLTATGNASVVLGSKKLIIGNNDPAGDQSFSGVISGTGEVEITGANNFVQIFSGANTYTGLTTISGGTLQVSGSLSDDTAVTIASGATYTLGANDTINNLLLDLEILIYHLIP